jgi:hypothetical protein
MNRTIGVLVGVGLGVLAFGAFRTSAGGWSQEAMDIWFWWIVIGGFLGIAAVGAVIGTVLHTRPEDR